MDTSPIEMGHQDSGETKESFREGDVYRRQEIVPRTLERIVWSLFEDKDHISRRNPWLFITCTGKNDPLLVCHASFDK